jgi:hypothetical protein
MLYTLGLTSVIVEVVVDTSDPFGDRMEFVVGGLPPPEQAAQSVHTTHNEQ